MVDAVLGTWKLTSSENFDELLKELGVGFMIRKLATAAKPNVEISRDGDDWLVIGVTIESSFHITKKDLLWHVEVFRADKQCLHKAHVRGSDLETNQHSLS